MMLLFQQKLRDTNGSPFKVYHFTATQRLSLNSFPFHNFQAQDSENKVTLAAPVAEKPIKEEWAIMVNATEPVKDFHKRVPDMAHKASYFT